MLVLPLKPAVRYDLSSTLAAWLDDSESQVSFQPTNPLQFVLPKPDFDSAACASDLSRLQSLRNCLTDVFCKSQSHKHALEEELNDALEDCYEYHAVLLEFEKRGFPTLDVDDQSSNNNTIKLTWKGAWPPHASEKHATLIWDRAVITFNVAALLSDKAADCSVTDRQACKQGVSYCQTAASCLAVLKELVASQDFHTVDLSVPCLSFWECLNLACAQNFIYRIMSIDNNADNSKHGTLAVLAQAAHQLYSQALTAAQDPRLLSELPEQAAEWGAYCKALSMLQAAKACYHQAVTHRLAHEWGREIYRLRESLHKLEACRDFCKSLDDDGVVGYTKRECLVILPVVRDRLHEADKDNYNIYQEQIPEELAEIPAKQLAKGNLGLPASMLTPKKALFVGL